MTYFLDFDRTLFATDAYNASLPDEPALTPFAEQLRATIAQGRDQTLSGGTERIEAWEKVSDAIRSGALTFPPGVLARFLYADVPEFLRALGNEAIIVTYGEVERQRIKIESALAGIPRITALYTGTVMKSDFLRTWSGYNAGPSLFVDDRPAELEGLAATFPDMKLYEMRRDGKEGDGRWPVIYSLTDLP